MAFRYSIGIMLVLFLSHARGDPIPSDAQTCIELCSSCNGIAFFEDDRCECDIDESADDGAECLLRMKRKAQDRGIDFLSCDSNSDSRSTRCILALKRKLLAKKSKLFGKNDIDQVAKYFMNDGPITGSFFQASLLGKNSDCSGASNIVVQPPETLQNPSSDCEDNRQFIPNPVDDCQGTPEQVVPHPLSLHIPSKHLLGSTPIVSKPPVGLNLLPKLQTHHQHQLGPIVPSPHLIGSSLPHHYLSSSHGNYLGAGHIITQPKGILDTSSYTLNAPVLADNCGQTVQGSSTPQVGSCKPVSIVGLQNLAPAFLQFLGRLSHPTLGIPGVIRTISESPSINSLVSAPGNFLNSIAESLGGGSNLLDDKSLQNDSADDGPEIGSPNDCVNAEEDEPPQSVGVQNSAVHIPSMSYLNPSVNSPFVGLINPNVGIHQSAQISYVNPAVGSSAPTQLSYIHSIPAYTTIPMIQNPIMNNLMPQLPASAYMVGSPYGIPYMNNYNSVSPSLLASSNSGTKLTGKSKSYGVPSLKSQKKICKKSAKEDTSKKMTRDVKIDSKSINEDIKLSQSQEYLNSISAQSNKHIDQATTEIPKIDRTTTQKSLPGSQIQEKIKLEKLARDNKKIDTVKIEKENGGKTKPLKEFIKKPKIDKKSTEQKSDVNS